MAEVVRERVTDYQATFAEMITERFPGCMNVMRLAMNLAVNRALFEAGCQCPQIGEVLEPYHEAQGQGVREAIRWMGEHATESLEAHRFLVAVTDLLSTGKGRLVPRREEVDHWKASDAIGYRDPVEQTVYLVPSICRKAISFHAGEDLSNISNRALYRQLEQIDALKETGTSRTTIKIRVGMDGQQCRVLAITPTKFGFGDYGRDRGEENEEDGQGDLPF